MFLIHIYNQNKLKMRENENYQKTIAEASNEIRSQSNPKTKKLLIGMLKTTQSIIGEFGD